MDDNWKKLFDLVGVTDEQKDTKETKEEKRGGIENVTREIERERKGGFRTSSSKFAGNYKITEKSIIYMIYMHKTL